jgi:hypothetical protein
LRNALASPFIDLFDADLDAVAQRRKALRQALRLRFRHQPSKASFGNVLGP